MANNFKPYILFVDDVEVNLMLLEENLKSTDALIVKAASGVEAISIIKNYPPALALIDVMMPEMNGYQLAEKIRNDKSIEVFPIIFITANNKNETDVFKGYESGAIDFIFKPFNNLVLRNKVRIFLEMDRQKRELDKIRQNLEKSKHELQVREIELEKQNEELKAAKFAAQYVAEKYTGLYDFAPSGFFTLSKEGKIIELNLAGAKMLGEKRSLLINSAFDLYISNDSKIIFNLFLTNIFNHKTKESCELSMLRNGKSPMYVFLTSILTENAEQCLVAIVDITKRKNAENEIIQSHKQLREYDSRLQQIREEERKNIAREIHDEFGQALSALKMNLSILRNEIKNTGKPLKRLEIAYEITNMNKIIDNTIKHVRVFTNKLRPDVLDNFGLVEALDTHIDEFRKLYSLKCNFLKPDEIEINSDKSIAIYRIVQEALTNVARHANATEINIFIDKKNDFLNVIIEDNGNGIIQKQSGEIKKFGIIGMKERAYICDGKLNISSEPGKGTKIELTIPLIKYD